MKRGINPYAMGGQPSSFAMHAGNVDYLNAHGDDTAQDSLRLAGRNELAIGRDGMINASSVADLLNNMNLMMQAAAQGQVTKKAKLSPAERQKRLGVLTAAWGNKDKWEVLGASIAEAIKSQGDREGFLRRLVNGAPLEQGQMPRVPMPAHDAVAVVATSSASVEYQIIRNKVFTPVEFSITANLRVENIELQQVSGDLLDNVYNQGLEAVMVAEDRLWKQAADATVGLENNLQYITGQLTPDILSAIRTGVTQWNLPASTMLLANDLWNDIIGNSNFHSLFDPVTRYDLVLNGSIGTIFGMEVITDAFRQPNQKVLERGEIYVVASPENHGTYTDRGGITPTPVDGSQTGTSTRGWFMEEFFSLVIANPRSVQAARRV